MFPEFGYFALIFALIASITQVGLSLWGELRRARYFLSLNPFLSLLQAVGTGISFASLAYAFLTDDFSVIYVAQHSNSQLPDFFKFAATWGGHEGSMLFWLTALTLWTTVFCLFSRKIDRLFANRTLAMISLVAMGFMLFILPVSYTHLTLPTKA